MEVRHIPKFTSFRPNKDNKSSEQSSKDVKKPDDVTSDKNETRPTRSRASDKAYEKSYHVKKVVRNGSAINPKSSSLLNPAYARGDGEPALFVIDRDGDRDNVKLGSNKSSSIPLHKESRIRQLIGADTVGHVPSSKPKNALSNLTADDRHTLLTHAPKSIIPSRGTNLRSAPHAVDESTENFLSLRPRKRQKLDNEVLPLGARQPHGPNGSYKDGAEDSEASDVSQSEEEDDQPRKPATGEDLTKERARLAGLVRKDPANVQHWLDLVNFQGQWSSLGQDEESDYRLVDHRPLAEVKVSIYKDALKVIGMALADKERLLIAMLSECELIYTKDKMTSLWRETIKNHPKSANLFLKYIDYLQTNEWTSGSKASREVFVRYLNILKATDRTDFTVEHRAQHYKQHVYALLRLTNFLRQSGLQEVAIAVWQALLELNAMSASPSRGDVESFQTFWDSEAPRIGEDGARGWQTGPGKTIDLPSFEESAEDMEDLAKPIDDLDRWSRQESKLSSAIRLPVRTTDEEDYSADDPFRIVFYDDIEPFLDQDSQPGFLELLINGFLCFMHISPLGITASQIDCRDWWNDAFLLPCTVSDEDGTSARSSSRSSSSPKLANFTARVLSTLLTSPIMAKPSLFHTALAEYHVAYLANTYSSSPKIALKAAQALLKGQPSSLRLYNAYALAAAKSDPAKSSLAFSSAITNAASLDAIERLNSPLLYNGWVWSAIQSRDQDLALQRLASFPDNHPINPGDLETNLDSTHKQLLDLIFVSTAFSTPLHAARTTHALALLALLAYTRASFTLDAALGVYADHLPRLHLLAPAHPLLETLHEQRAHLVLSHTTASASISPRAIRDALEPSVLAFPASRVIRRAWRANEARFLFDEHVRRLASRNARDAERGEGGARGALEDVRDAVARVARVAQSQAGEQGVHANAASVNAALSLFATVLASRPGSHRGCAALWWEYLTFLSTLARDAHSRHAQRGTRYKSDVEVADARLRSAFWAAVSAVGWSKGIVMLAFEDEGIGSMLGEQGKRQVLERAEEVGIRFLVPPPF